MDTYPIKLHRKNAPTWLFEWDDDHCGMVHKTKNNVYRLFMDGVIDAKPVWIGRLLKLERHIWVTWEKEIKADYIDFIGCRVTFK